MCWLLLNSNGAVCACGRWSIINSHWGWHCLKGGGGRRSRICVSVRMFRGVVEHPVHKAGQRCLSVFLCWRAGSSVSAMQRALLLRGCSHSGCPSGRAEGEAGSQSSQLHRKTVCLGNVLLSSACWTILKHFSSWTPQWHRRCEHFESGGNLHHPGSLWAWKQQEMWTQWN